MTTNQKQGEYLCEIEAKYAINEPLVQEVSIIINARNFPDFDKKIKAEVLKRYKEWHTGDFSFSAYWVSVSCPDGYKFKKEYPMVNPPKKDTPWMEVFDFTQI